MKLPTRKGFVPSYVENRAPLGSPPDYHVREWTRVAPEPKTRPAEPAKVKRGVVEAQGTLL